PDHAPSYRGLGDMLVAQGRQMEAQQMMQAWVDTQPYSPQARAGLASVQRQSGDLASAEQTLKQSLAMNPRQPAALNELAEVYRQSGRSAEASSLYQSSLAINPYQMNARSRALTLRNQNQSSGAMQMANTMQMNDPTFSGGSMMAGGYGVPATGGLMPASGMQMQSYAAPSGYPQTTYMPTAPSNMPMETYNQAPMTMSPYGAPATMSSPQMVGPYQSMPTYQPMPAYNMPTNGAPPLPTVPANGVQTYPAKPQAMVPSPYVQLGTPIPTTTWNTGVQTTPTMMTTPTMAQPQRMMGAVPTTTAF
ncbi:MAG: tetratricopeptide repeat protein, partial [Planctomycetaceae bacterium]|nr:tetratricopeptide repeat protein [Planctomycetaceae bacterium]